MINQVFLGFCEAINGHRRALDEPSDQGAKTSLAASGINIQQLSWVRVELASRAQSHISRAYSGPCFVNDLSLFVSFYPT